MLQQLVKQIAEWAAAMLELVGIGAIILVAGVATIIAIRDMLKRARWQDVFNDYRAKLSRGILLGLEFLVGADIIHTVAVDLTYASIGVLVIVVLVRTFLSFTLELEISGRWPWQRARPSSSI